MSDVTRILQALERGDPLAGEQLLPVVYNELRKLAGYKMAGEAPGHTLQATALVHEAWLRLVGNSQPTWQNRAHFFAAAGEAMRRILVEHARRKHSLKRGGHAQREELDESVLVLTAPPDELLAVNDALDQLATEDPAAAELVKLRYFVGMTMPEAASALGLAPRTAERLWTFARVWLRRRIRSEGDFGGRGK
jgi:RNA polymerase sigma factor (TIGR02999 family)